MNNFNKNKTKSTYLLPSNSFLVGFGSILNIFGIYFSYNYSKTEKEADYKAIACDWKMVGNDIRNALKAADYEQGRK